MADDYLRIVDLSGRASVQIDADGTTGPATFRPLVTLTGLTAKQVLPARGLGL